MKVEISLMRAKIIAITLIGMFFVIVTVKFFSCDCEHTCTVETNKEEVDEISLLQEEASLLVLKGELEAMEIIAKHSKQLLNKIKTLESYQSDRFLSDPN